MNKRSKVSLVILVIVILFIFASLLSDGKKKDNDKDLENFENEIVDPNNELNPLDYDSGNNVLLIDVALKTESVIEKIFSNIDSAHAYVMMQPGIDYEEQTGFYTDGNTRYYNGYQIKTDSNR